MQQVRIVLFLAFISLLYYSLSSCRGEEGMPTVTPATPVSMPCVPQASIKGQANFLHNPSFENGEEPWCVIHLPKFKITQKQSHSGKSSALLQMQVPAKATGSKVYYLVQEIVTQEFPEFISGYYLVEKWNKGTPKQYLQFVVIVFGAANLPSGFSNHQIRYPLAGISEDPFKISNAYFVYVGKGEPQTGKWVYFERNIKQDFKKLWGTVPQGFNKIRILFEVRFDNKEVGASAEAEVYYDDLYIGGPADKKPN